jgi:hypothetical protein
VKLSIRVNLGDDEMPWVPKWTAEKSIHPIKVESATGSRAGQPGLVGKDRQEWLGRVRSADDRQTLDQSR